MPVKQFFLAANRRRRLTAVGFNFSEPRGRAVVPDDAVYDDPEVRVGPVGRHEAGTDAIAGALNDVPAVADEERSRGAVAEEGNQRMRWAHVRLIHRRGRRCSISAASAASKQMAPE